MHDYIKERTLLMAQYFIDTQATVRGVAQHFGISKSTVHKDLAERLMNINRTLGEEVRKILLEHKAERHLRGGEATKMKYSKKKSIIDGIRV